MTNPHPVIERRLAERASLVAVARAWAQRAAPMLKARAAVVVGSVARGDFNKWSDIDVLVVCDDLPAGLSERLALVATTHRPPRIQAILWTPEEFAARRALGRDPLANEASSAGIVVFGQLDEG